MKREHNATLCKCVQHVASVGKQSELNRHIDNKQQQLQTKLC